MVNSHIMYELYKIMRLCKTERKYFQISILEGFFCKSSSHVKSCAICERRTPEAHVLE